MRPEEYWQVQGREINKAAEKFIGKPSSVKDEADKAIAGATTPEEKLRKLYARAQSLRNLSFGAIDPQTKESRSAADVLKVGAGFRDEINRAFVCMARAEGIDADVMRVSSRNHFFFSDKLPDPDQMNTEATLVNLDGKPLLLDPGTPPQVDDSRLYNYNDFSGYAEHTWRATKNLVLTSGLRVDVFKLKGDRTPEFFGTNDTDPSGACLPDAPACKTAAEAAAAGAVEISGIYYLYRPFDRTRTVRRYRTGKSKYVCGCGSRRTVKCHHSFA